MLLGINTASIRYIAQQKNDKEKLISTAYFSVLFLTIISILILFALKTYFENLFKIDNTIFLFAIIYSVALALKYLSEAVAKGWHQFKLLSKLNVINAFFVFISFFLFILLTKNYTFKSYSIATSIGLIIFFLIVIFRDHVQIAFFDKTAFKKLMHYGLFASVGSISGFALNNIDRVVLNNYLGFSAVGLFAAYLSASSFFSGQLLQIFIDVFFPSISAAEDKKIIYEKIKKIFYVSAVPLFLLNVLATGIIIKLYGAKYELNYTYVLLFSLLGVLTLCQSVSWWFIASFGRKGVRFTSISGLFIGFFNILLMIFLVRLFGLFGAVTGLNITALIILIYSIIYIKNKWKD